MSMMSLPLISANANSSSYEVLIVISSPASSVQVSCDVRPLISWIASLNADFSAGRVSTSYLKENSFMMWLP